MMACKQLRIKADKTFTTYGRRKRTIGQKPYGMVMTGNIRRDR